MSADDGGSYCLRFVRRIQRMSHVFRDCGVGLSAGHDDRLGWYKQRTSPKRMLIFKTLLIAEGRVQGAGCVGRPLSAVCSNAVFSIGGRSFPRLLALRKIPRQAFGER